MVQHAAPSADVSPLPLSQAERGDVLRLSPKEQAETSCRWSFVNTKPRGRFQARVLGHFVDCLDVRGNRQKDRLFYRLCPENHCFHVGLGRIGAGFGVALQPGDFFPPLGDTFHNLPLDGQRGQRKSQRQMSSLPMA